MQESSSRDTVLYAGGFGLPSATASAIRALENARLMQSIGYRVVILGKFRSRNSSVGLKGHTAEIEGVTCFNIESPTEGRSFSPYTESAEAIKAVATEVGLDRIHSLIFYNYPSRGLIKGMTLGRQYCIPVVAECTEWYGWEGLNPIRNIRRLFDTQRRMRWLAHKTRNVICASTHAAQFFGGCNTLVLPFVLDNRRPKWLLQPSQTRRPYKFVYAGSPGKGFSKDSIDLLLDVFQRVSRVRHSFELRMVGTTAAEVVRTRPRLKKVIKDLGKRVSFHGRVPHEQALDFLKSSDISCFFRPNSKQCQFGFPTKVAEAFACGVLTLTNETSDISRYVADDRNGWVLPTARIQDLVSAIIRILDMAPGEIERMKDNVRQKNPFGPQEFASSMTRFLARLEPLDRSRAAPSEADGYTSVHRTHQAA